MYYKSSAYNKSIILQQRRPFKPCFSSKVQNFLRKGVQFSIIPKKKKEELFEHVDTAVLQGNCSRVVNSGGSLSNEFL